ncbi:MAG: flagellin [Methylococcales bacterium]|nr:flagellin [Methylococcales bacterium]
MSTVINTNVSALNSQRQLGASAGSLATSMERLSSGLRVNSAKDDAAGLAIGNRMTSQIRGQTVAVRNANDGISMAQTTESAMGNMTDMMQRMRDLAVQSANTGAVGSGDRAKMQDEFSQLGLELKRTIDNTSFNGKKVLAGDLSAQNFQVGFSTAADNQISINVANMTTASGVGSLFGATAVSIGASASPSAVLKAVNALDIAIKTIDSSRSKLGAVQNRFTATISNLQSSIENNSAAKSRIMDADFATETANLSRNQILQQAGTAMLSQANQSSQGVLKLLQ